MKKKFNKKNNELLIIDDFKENKSIIDNIYLTNTEVNLFYLLLSYKNELCNYEKIIKTIYNISKIIDKSLYMPSLRVTINRLKIKLEKYYDIKNIYGKGYKLIEKC